MKKLSAVFSLLFVFAGSTFSNAQRNEAFRVSSGEISYGYVVKKIWLNNYGMPKVQLSAPVYKMLGELPKDVNPDSPEKLEISIGLERKRPFALIYVPAYSVNTQKQPAQLTSFSLSINENGEPKPLPVAKTTASSSVLASGDWYKISVTERGIYKVDYDFIQNKLGVNPSTIAPGNIRLYGNGGVMLSENNADPRADDLIENAIYVNDGGDGSFNQGDYILFYANGPMDWKWDNTLKLFTHRKHLYEDKSYYFLNFDLGQGKRVSAQAGTPASNINVTDFNDYQVHEEDIINIGSFGKEWWGEEFSTEPGKQATRSFSFPVGTLTDSARIRMVLGSRTFGASSQFAVRLNGILRGSYNLPGVGTAGEDAPVTSTAVSLKLPVSGGAANFELSFAPGISSGRGFLNYIELNAKRILSLSGMPQLSFRNVSAVSAGNVASYQLQNAAAAVTVWDITDALEPVKMSGSLSGSSFSFKQDASALHEFIAFDGSQFLSPGFVRKVDNQDLHGSAQVDLIIVTHPDFLASATRLGDFHRQHDNMRVVVATTDQVYNEFGSGSQDLSAIRDFARMFYKRAGTDSLEMPRHLLLFGDASYDYKDRVTHNTNFVPTHETSESMNVISGYCTDDFFSFLDDNEGIELWDVPNTMDLGVGRLPIGTETEAEEVVDKIISYTQPAALGPWRLSTTIMSDNNDGNIHYEDGEIMAATVKNSSSLYNENKIYLSAIPLVSTPGGLRAPDANKAVNDAVFKGTFLMNYNGHGSITTLAHERILTQDDFNNWKNADKLPIMVTATCEFSKYDDPVNNSAGEKLIMKANGGAIALLTTTQLVYQYLNRPMNKEFLSSLFRQYDEKWPTLGDAFRYSKNITYAKKNDSYTLANYRKFALLGDPALTPAFPKHKIYTEGILDGNTLQPADTVKALGLYKINGKVTDDNNQLLTDFNGRVYVTIYDKPKSMNTLAVDGSPVQTFSVQNNIVYRGKASVINGLFSFSFIAPKDLNYEYGEGKISYYAENGVTDAAGADYDLTIGGFTDNPIPDDEGPVVKAYIDDSLFVDGGITGSNTVLFAKLYDETGINVSGNGIGHDLTAILDGDVQHPYILNDYYETEANQYQRGYVFFPITGLADGKHSLVVKAWDVNNNSGEGTVHFEVVNGNIVKVLNLMNYPNPFTDLTHFVFEHNHPGEKLNVDVNIYSSAGYLVRTLSQDLTPDGSRSSEMTWDGTDNNGYRLPSGVYVYRISVATEKGIQAIAYQKLVIVR